MGKPLHPGEDVVIVVAMPPVKGFGRFAARVVKPKGRKVGIRLNSDFVRGIRYVLPDCIASGSTWTRLRKSQ